MNAPVLHSEYLFSYTATLAEPVVLGPCADGIRVLFQVTGGEITGGRIGDGEVCPVGGDWLTVRPDGVANVDVRAQLRTTDGVLLDIRYGGVIDFGEDGYAAFAEGRLDPIVQIQTAPRVYTASPGHQWLCRRQLVGIGVGNLVERTVSYDVYAVS